MLKQIYMDINQIVTPKSPLVIVKGPKFLHSVEYYYVVLIYLCLQVTFVTRAKIFLTDGKFSTLCWLTFRQRLMGNSYSNPSESTRSPAGTCDCLP